MPTLSIGQNQVVPALSYVGPAQQSETTSEANSSFSASNPNPNPEKLIYVYERAAKAIPKYHRYTQENVIEFLAKEYPKVPGRHCLALIHGATAAAQTVANLFMLWEGARTASDDTSRATAEAAPGARQPWRQSRRGSHKISPNGAKIGLGSYKFSEVID